jgi:CRISPR/Cas system CSM-associated protein Csm2 small subunit
MDNFMKSKCDISQIIAEVIDKINVVASLTKEDFFEERFNAFFDELAV